jgi:hypothetical protein
VAEDHRTPRTDVIDITLVVFVGNVSTFSVLEEQRRAANARTGEFTPPGMCFWALANRVSERDMIGLSIFRI